MIEHPLLADWIASRDQLRGNLLTTLNAARLYTVETAKENEVRRGLERQISQLNRLIYRNTPASVV